MKSWKEKQDRINFTDLSLPVFARQTSYKMSMDFLIGFDAISLFETTYMNAANHDKQLLKVSVNLGWRDEDFEL